MKKIDPIVFKETSYIAAIVFVLSLTLQAVFFISGKWNYTVLSGNILGFVASVGNFFIMGLSVQASLGKDEKDAKILMKFSQILRLLFVFIIFLVSYLLSNINIIAVLVPLLFPRIAVSLRPLFTKKKQPQNR